jgi:APA family basic amino acid/polyamine antiporter
MSFLKSLFRIKPAESHGESRGELRRCLTAFDLTCLGVGAIIGAGVFVLTGVAAATEAGPAIIFSYLLAGVACGFAALCYAELASTFGGCGSAYGYAYASIGEFFAWLIGWDLLLEYGMNTSTISIGWSSYVQNILQAMGIHLPYILTTDPTHGGFMNLPAAIIIFLLAMVLSVGVKESLKFNNWIVLIKLCVIALFIGIGSFYFNPQNWHPFLPFGTQGIVNGAGLIFFAYIGFDAVTTAGEECVNPKRDLPIGILASLLICTVVYIIVAAVLTGIASYPSLNVNSPVASALENVGQHFSAEIIAVGAIAGLTTAIMGMYFGFTRIFLAMSRDGLLPESLAKINKKSQTPKRLIWSVGVIMAIAAGFIPIDQIATLVNMGTLAAFVTVCGSVLVLRITQPKLARPFKAPLYPLVPILGIAFCGYLMMSLPKVTWLSFLTWTLFGLVVYLFYSRSRSFLALETSAASAE